MTTTRAITPADIRALTILTFMLMLLTIYMMMSFNCATGGSCTFANDGLANWICPRVLAAEKWFYAVFGPALPG